MYNNLILRTLNSPFSTPFTDITKGSVLSHADVDSNFIYLKGNIIYGAEVSGNTFVLKKIDGGEINLSLSAVTNDIYTTGATLENNTIYFNRNDTLSAYTVNLSSFTQNSSYKETIFLTGNTPYTVNHNLNNLDIIVQVKNLTNNEMINVTVDNYQVNSVDLTSVIDITNARIIIVGA